MTSTQSVCAFVASGVQHTKRMRHIIICDLPHSTTFVPHYLIKGMIFEKKNTEHKMCLDFLYRFIWNIFYSKKNWAIYDRKCISVFTLSTRYSCPILMKQKFSRHSFEKKKSSNIRFHENPPGGSWVAPCGRTVFAILRKRPTVQALYG